ncbi:MAG: O-linked N-acetylglucosamine transferase family protein [Phycisphaerae bacterium]
MSSIASDIARGIDLQRQNNLDAAADAYRSVLAADPANLTANTGIAIVLQQLGKLTEAETHLLRCLAQNHTHSLQLGILASNRLEQGRIHEACDAAADARRLDPRIPQLQSNHLLYSLYDDRLSTEQRYALHRDWGRSFLGPPLDTLPAPRRRIAGTRLRIGYVSADFRNHPVGTFLEPVLRHHDHAAFEIFCYSDVASEDATTARLRRFADHWISTRDSGGGGGGGGGAMPDAALADRIRHDGIDILINLAGHTQDNRLALFAAGGTGPAPVQLLFIGYPFTSGLPSIRYRFSDALLDPPGPDDALYSEKTVRLPAFWCYQPPDPCPPVGPLPGAAGAPFTFGSFNNLAKINAVVIETWSRILLKVPGSRLLLKYKALHDAGVRERFIAAFARHGIDPQRIETLPGTSVKEYMADFNRIDLGLDPFPFNGGTTTFNSFYMGVPVIALEGRGHAERMGAALLRHVGLDEFVAPTIDAYVERAVAAAHDLPRLAEIRRTLRQRLQQSPLMDAPGYTRAYESALRDLYADHLATANASAPLPAAAPVPTKPARIERIAAETAATPDFSIIFAGRDPHRRAKTLTHLQSRFHSRPFEILYINDPPSLAAAYNAAIAQSRSQHILLMHDDAEILNEDAPERLLSHLKTYDLVGIAGTTRLVNGVWSHAGQPHIFGQVANPAAAPVKEGYTLCVFGGVSAIAGGMQALDGVFMAGRRETFEQIRFDEETFDGFHLYDTDFSFRAFRAGLKLAVANDIHLFHQSVGSYDAVWRHYHERFLQKFARELPAAPQKKIWFAQIYCRTREELREKMLRNSSPSRGFTF